MQCARVGSQRPWVHRSKAGEAVHGTPIVVGGPESVDVWKHPSHDSEGREIVFDSEAVAYIITGVPRSDRDPGFCARLQRESEREDYDIPNKPPAYQPPVETTKIPPPSKPAPQPERPPQPRRIVVQTRECLDNDDAGEIVEGYYDVRGGILYVWDAQNNSPIGQQRINPGDDPAVAARKILREKSGKHSSFYQPIWYRSVH